MMHDLVIRGGEVLDGSGSEARRADVAVRDGRIAAVGDLADVAAAAELDAAGRLVAPGFIDVHGHSDVGLYVNPPCQSKVVQGITTEVMGNCGFSPFPILENNRNYLLDPEGVALEWSSAGEYFERVGGTGRRHERGAAGGAHHGAGRGSRPRRPAGHGVRDRPHEGPCAGRHGGGRMRVLHRARL